MRNQIVKTFKALSDSHRLQILALLKRQPLFVCEISQLLGLAFSTTSQHLAILREAELIEDFKEGRWVKYARVKDSENPFIQQILNLVDEWISITPHYNIDLKMLNKICSTRRNNFLKHISSVD